MDVRTVIAPFAMSMIFVAILREQDFLEFRELSDLISIVKGTCNHTTSRSTLEETCQYWHTGRLCVEDPSPYAPK